MTEIVPATLEHLLKMYGQPPAFSVRAFAAVNGDKVKGLAGIYRSNHMQTFFVKLGDISKRDIVKLSRKAKTLLNGVVYTQRDESKETADRFIRHFGFQPLTDKVYVWTQ